MTVRGGPRLGAHDLGRRADGDVRRRSIASIRYVDMPAAEVRATDHQRDLLAVAGEVQDRLPGRVAAADDDRVHACQACAWETFAP